MTTTVTVLELSTGHLPEKTAINLGNPELHKYPYMSGSYGWLFVVPEDPELLEETCKTCGCEHLANCFRQAAKENCHYLLFDRDADFHEELESFDW